MSDSDERFVAKRGSQGDEWRWDDTPPAAKQGSLSNEATGAAPAGRLPRPASLVITLAAVLLSLATVLGAVLAISALNGGDDSTPVSALGSPTPLVTLIPAASQTPSPSETAAATPVPTISLAPTPPARQGPVSIALWANGVNAWWFGTVDGSAASYREGQTVPLLVQWDASPGKAYRVLITYDCAADGSVNAIDFLSGAADWGNAVTLADNGPGKEQPDGDVPVRDTPAFAADDGNAGRFWVYGGLFSRWADEPSPGGACPGQRTVSLPIYATTGTVWLLASAHLGLSSPQGTGASKAAAPFAVSVTVEGLGSAAVAIDPSAISDEAG